MIRGDRSVEMSRQRCQPPVGNFIPKQDLSGQSSRVEYRPTREWVLTRLTGAAEEADIKSSIVRNDHRSLCECEECRQHLAQCRFAGNHLVGDACQDCDQRGNMSLWIDEGLELAQHLTAPHLDRP